MAWRYKKGTNNHPDGAYKKEDDTNNHKKKVGILGMTN